MDVDVLRKKWSDAVRADRPRDAAAALVALERAQPDEPRWSQRLGETLRRLGSAPDAAHAFARACARYTARGLVPQALAMAKLVGSTEPARGEQLERSIGRGVEAAPRSAPRAVPPPPPALLRAAPLSPRPDDDADTLSFEDAPTSTFEVPLDELELAIEVDDDDDVSPTLRMSDRRARSEAHSMTASVRLFASLPPEALAALSAASEVVEFEPGASVFQRDQRAHALFAIVSGVARVSVANGAPVFLGEGDVFGESALLLHGTRSADVCAYTRLSTLRIGRERLGTVTREHPAVQAALFDLLARRLVANVMHAPELFAALDPTQRLLLAQRFEIRRAAPGTVLAEARRRSDGLYIVLAGRVVAIGSDARPTPLRPGTVFGKASLLGGSSDVTVRAETEALVLRLPGETHRSSTPPRPPLPAPRSPARRSA